MQITQFLSRSKRRATSVAAACGSRHKQSPNTQSQGAAQSIEGSAPASCIAPPISMPGLKQGCRSRGARPPTWQREPILTPRESENDTRNRPVR